jgi:iron complex transport system substrate-binding protein
MKLKHLLFSTLIFALLVACGAPAATALPQAEVNVTEATATAPVVAETVFPLTLTDGLGRTITLDAPAERIVSLAASNTEILFAIGAGSQVIGRDPYSDYPAEAAAVTDIGDTFVELNTELIISLEPDLVLAAEITPAEQVAQLEQLGVNVYWLANPTDFEGLYANLAILGQIAGHEDEAAALSNELQQRVAAVDAAVAGVTDRPSVFYELDASDPAAPWTSGSGTFIDLIINRAGGVNAAASLSGAFAQFSIEQLLVENPDVILLGDSNYGVTPENVAARAGWDGLLAVQTGQVFAFDDNLISRPGPRLVEALERIARILHPDLFN